MTGQYYAQLLGRFEDALKKKRPHLAKKKAGTPIPRCRSEIGGIGLRIAATFTVFSRFSPRRFFLFPKKLLGGERFASNEEVITEIGAYFVEFDKSYFLEGLKKLESRWAKCIELKGDYVEK
jgi:hypothetical protein